ncbi:hypothetical protein SEVIR_9G274200v4 [Setaria viridis]|uniref:Uncharacterized protein n=1 Tax=Setaria viridis TaxID=4556 RepID=A0A4U6T143_SETVI|nr:uncharacterized protein LOC117839656 isoform X2 [Setaria viridis]TKV94158.1 hypothetical protein SEVIR_9G274200v2 [Setaria viridis]
MGNCQTADAVAVVIQHPPGGGVGGGRVERAHGALSAAAVMAANPGHYVAAVIPGDDAAAAASRARKRRLKLLRPDDTLALGGVYRLVSFEEVLREFVSKRHATLSRRMVVATAAADAQRPESDRSLAQEQEEELHRGEEIAIPKRPVGRRAILHRRDEMGHLRSKQGMSMANKAQLPSPDQEATSSPPDPTANDLRPSDLEPDFSAALVMLGGRLGLARHGQWRPALPSIAEGSVAC